MLTLAAQFPFLFLLKMTNVVNLFGGSREVVPQFCHILVRGTTILTDLRRLTLLLRESQFSLR